MSAVRGDPDAAYYQRLQADLGELERTDPAVAEASRRLDEATRQITQSPDVERDQ